MKASEATETISGRKRSARQAMEAVRAVVQQRVAWLDLAFLAALFFAARYWHSGQFGLYEDDLTFVPRAAVMSVSQIANFIWTYITHLYGHGRPLSDSSYYLFAFLAWRAGGLTTAYAIGFIIEVINIGLFYGLLRRALSPSFALLGGLAYVLFSADTTQALLTHSFGLHTAVMLMLLAFHAYLSRKLWLFYLIAAVMLFHYESPFPVLLAAPLLVLPWDRRLLKELARHGLILGAMMGVIAVIRGVVLQEERLTDLSLLDMVKTPLLHMVQGPLVALGTYLYRPVQALQALNVEILLAMLVACAALALFLPDEPARSLSDGRAVLAAVVRRKFDTVPEETRSFLKLALTGLAMLALAYPLTFTVRAYAISGRDTRVHLAAAAGAAIVIASGCRMLLGLAAAYKKPAWGKLAVAALFSLLVGYGFVVQSDYARAWQYQRQFWTELLPLIQDAGEGTVVMVEPSGLKEARQIGANTWNVPRVLIQIYTFPSTWSDPPRVFRLTPEWQSQIAAGEGLLQLNVNTTVAPPSLYQTVDSRQVIFIETQGGRMVRRSEPLEIDGQAFPRKQAPAESSAPALSDYETGFLYPYLVSYSLP